jgi:hypothetical protein
MSTKDVRFLQMHFPTLKFTAHCPLTYINRGKMYSHVHSESTTMSIKNIIFNRPVAQIDQFSVYSQPYIYNFHYILMVAWLLPVTFSFIISLLIQHVLTL